MHLGRKAGVFFLERIPVAWQIHRMTCHEDV